MSEMNPKPFNLDERLSNDSIVMGDFPLSRVLLMNEARYPWFILVPRVDSVTEIYQLSSFDQLQLFQESVCLAQWMSETFLPDKMNVAAIGNIVRQLHVHHVARRVGDASWPKPVWGQLEPEPYADSICQEMLQLFESSSLKERVQRGRP